MHITQYRRGYTGNLLVIVGGLWTRELGNLLLLCSFQCAFDFKTQLRTYFIGLLQRLRDTRGYEAPNTL